jgi:uncharacterized protein YciI
MRYVMAHETRAEHIPLARLRYAAHRARLDEFHARGTVLMAGPFADAADGAPGVFTTRAAAQECVAGDPFVLCGLVKSCTIHGWNEILAT